MSQEIMTLKSLFPKVLIYRYTGVLKGLLNKYDYEIENYIKIQEMIYTKF